MLWQSSDSSECCTDYAEPPEVCTRILLTTWTLLPTSVQPLAITIYTVYASLLTELLDPIIDHPHDDKVAKPYELWFWYPGRHLAVISSFQPGIWCRIMNTFPNLPYLKALWRTPISEWAAGWLSILFGTSRVELLCMLQLFVESSICNSTKDTVSGKPCNGVQHLTVLVPQLLLSVLSLMHCPLYLPLAPTNNESIYRLRRLVWFILTCQITDSWQNESREVHLQPKKK